MVALLSGVQERLQERIGPLRAWLFPQRVYLQLEDQAITAMALDGRRIIWLERVDLPVGLIEQGDPVRVDALGDLLGDLFVERGFAGALVSAVLPPVASQMRLVQWPEGCWPDDPERTLVLNEEQLALKVSLQYLDIHLLELDREPPTSLVVTVPSSTLDKWIEVFVFAGLSLARMEASKLCVCRGAQPLLTGQGVTAVVQLERQRSSLMVLEDALPVFEHRLPGAEHPRLLQDELKRALAFWSALRPDLGAPVLLLHGAALSDDDQAAALSETLGCTSQLLDPLAHGWLMDVSPDFGLHPEGSALAVLWGLAAAEVLA